MVAVATVATATFPAAATAAAPAAAPPGNSAVNQYTETFPTAEGPRETNSLQTARPRSPRRALGAPKARRLQASGADGRRLAALAAATAPRRAAGRSAAGGQGQTRGGSAGAAVAGQALGTSSSGRLGLVLPLIIVASVVWAVSFAWRRRLRSA